MYFHDLKRFSLALAAVVTLITVAAHAEEFYTGKTINFIIGGNPGGGYDIYHPQRRAFWRRLFPG